MTLLPCLALHPCNAAQVMALLLRTLPCDDLNTNDDELRQGTDDDHHYRRSHVLHHYIASWLSVVETAMDLKLTW